MKKLIYILATGFYAGKCPIAPGTAGSLVGVLFYLLLRYLPDAVYIPTVIAFIFLAAWVATQAQEIFGLQDPPEIVIDEIAGFLVTMAFHQGDILLIIGGFILFRIFDIVKPFPANWAEKRFISGWGVVLDDVFAGIYANAALWLFGLILPII
ncbi:MAG: phosphatidylglycerophosphatase A [Pseudomonadota bacterium]